jgi:hypothetical protein
VIYVYLDRAGTALARWKPFGAKKQDRPSGGHEPHPAPAE